MRTLLLLLLMCSVCYADRPDYPPGRDLNPSEQAVVKAWLGGKIFKELTPARNDYDSRTGRGTVYFNPEKGINGFGREVFVAANYSHHKVIIPNETTIKEVNFSQENPHTNAINGLDLYFINCNLTNVQLHPSWTYDGGVRGHVRRSIIEESGKTYGITEREIDEVFVEMYRYEIIPEE